MTVPPERDVGAVPVAVFGAKIAFVRDLTLVSLVDTFAVTIVIENVYHARIFSALNALSGAFVTTNCAKRHSVGSVMILMISYIVTLAPSCVARAVDIWSAEKTGIMPAPIVSDTS